MTRTEKKREIRAQQVAWVQSLIKVTGQSRSTLATNAGLASNMLTRFLDERYEGLLTATTVELLKNYVNLPGPETMGTNNRPLCAGEARELDADAMLDLPEIIRTAVEAVLAKSPNATAWMIESRAIEAAGWLLGDIVIVDSLLAPERGDPVFVQAINSRGAEHVIVRLYEPPFLVAASHDPALRKPIIDDPQHVRICGAVVGRLTSDTVSCLPVPFS